MKIHAQHVPAAAVRGAADDRRAPVSCAEQNKETIGDGQHPVQVVSPASDSIMTALHLLFAGLFLTVATGSPHANITRNLPADPLPSLAAQPPVLTVDGESVLVGWQDQFNPLDGDRVLMSCGVRSHPLDFLGKNGELSVNATTRSVHTAALINMRCNYTATYVRSGEVLSQLEIPLAPGLANAPSQGHIAFADRDDQMHVLWVSASDAVPTVRYSTTPTFLDASVSQGLQHVATGSSGTYTADMMCSAPANQTGQQLFIDPGRMHRVLLEGLLPDTDYYYSYGNARDGFSDERRFRSKPSSRAPAAAPHAHGLGVARPVKFLAFADQDWDDGVGASPTTANYCLRDAIESGFEDFLLHFGDLAYAESTGAATLQHTTATRHILQKSSALL